MTSRGRYVSWAVIVISAVFIGSYLLHYGEAAYRAEAVPEPAPPAVAAPAPMLPPAAGEPAPAPPQAAPAALTPTVPPKEVVPAPAPSQPKVEPTKPPASEAPPKAVAPAPPPQPAAAEGTPSIKWEETSYDFGSVYQQEAPEHQFVFTNTGTAPLRIIQVVTTCACAAGKIPDKPIPPGGKGSITVTFLAGQLRGKVTKYIFVFSNDPAMKRSLLTITAEVKLEVEAVPSGLYFGSLKLGDSVERPIVIRPVGVRSFHILGVKSESPLITVAPPQPAGPPEPEGSYRLVVKIGPVTQVGQISSRLVVRTDLPHQKELLIPVYGRAVELSQSRATTTQ
jgi:hypothetical protein